MCLGIPETAHTFVSAHAISLPHFCRRVVGSLVRFGRRIAFEPYHKGLVSGPREPRNKLRRSKQTNGRHYAHQKAPTDDTSSAGENF